MGLQGEQGSPGEQGPQGEPGNANIQVHVFTLNGNAFDHEGKTAIYTRNISSITQAVVQSGGVFAYTDLGSAEAGWFALPYVIAADADVTVVLGYGYAVGGIIISVQGSDDRNYTSTFTGFAVKIVVVPPAASKSGIDFTDYEAVARHYGLE